MKQALTISAIFLLSLLVFNSCSKYEDGPGISLRSKKGRVANTWKIEKIKDLNTDKEITIQDYFDISDLPDTSVAFDLNLVMEKNGSLEIIAIVQPINVKVATGTWEFVGDTGIKATITAVSGQAASIEGTILRLANNELWIKDKDNYQLNLVTAN